MQFYSLLTKIPNKRSFLLILLFSLCFACSKSKDENTNKGKEKESKTDAAVNITIEKIVSRRLPSYIQATGSFVADETSDVAPKSAGKIVNIYANVGQFISQGTVIAKLDDKDTRQRLRDAEIGVNQAEAAVRQAEVRIGLTQNETFNSSTIPEVRAANTTIEQLQAELKQAEANEKRYRELVETGDVAMITYETFRTTRDTARLRVKNAKEQLNAVVNSAKQNNQAIKTAQANVESAKNQVVTAKQAFDDLVVKAPFSGFVGSRSVAVGEFVSSSTPILTLLRVNPIKAQIQISEADVANISIGRGVSVEVDAYKDRKFGGTVTAVNPAFSTTSRSVVVEAQIENGNNILRPGMFATARIVKEGSNEGVFAPKSSVLNDQATQSYRIFVIQEGVAKLRTVQIGNEENDMMQVLSGVAPEESVATSNLEQLYEGAKVVF
jgi:multidrug efflux pump subunit AcrA (membrane-fusion protein)